MKINFLKQVKEKLAKLKSAIKIPAIKKPVKLPVKLPVLLSLLSIIVLAILAISILKMQKSIVTTPVVKESKKINEIKQPVKEQKKEMPKQTRNIAIKEEQQQAVSLKKPELEPFESYGSILQVNPFASVWPTNKEQVEKTKVTDQELMPVDVQAKPVTELQKVLGENKLQSIIITGRVMVNGVEKIFIENQKTNETFYLAKGEKENNVEVVDIKENTAILRIDNVEKEISIMDK